jgi:hypothetical protein
MSPTITILLAACFAFYALTLLVEAVKGRFSSFILLQVGGLAAAFLVLHWSTGFPSPREAFAATTSIFAIAVLISCGALGAGANYFFYLEKGFSWRGFLKPCVLSPIVVLPLLGFVESGSGIESHQLIYLAVVAFQNGFFWKSVLEREKRRVK